MSEEEVKANPRSRSAWLRVAERLEQRRVMKSSDEIETTENKVVKKLWYMQSWWHWFYQCHDGGISSI